MIHDARKVEELKDLLDFKIKKCPMHKGLCGSKNMEILGVSASGKPFLDYDSNRYHFQLKCGNGHRFELMAELVYLGE